MEEWIIIVGSTEYSPYLKKGCRNAALFFAHLYGKTWLSQNLSYFPYKKKKKWRKLS